LFVLESQIWEILKIVKILSKKSSTNELKLPINVAVNVRADEEKILTTVCTLTVTTAYSFGTTASKHVNSSLSASESFHLLFSFVYTLESDVYLLMSFGLPSVIVLPCYALSYVTLNKMPLVSNQDLQSLNVK